MNAGAAMDLADIENGTREVARSQVELREAGKYLYCWRKNTGAYHDLYLALTRVIPVCGQKDKMLAHLKHCIMISPEKLKEIIIEVRSEKENQPPTPLSTPNMAFHQNLPFLGTHQDLASPHHPPTRPLKRKRTSQSNFSLEAPIMWDESTHTEFASDMCKLFVACGFAWNSADNPEMRIFLEKWIPGVRVPGRRVLAGVVLDGEVELVEKTRLKGRWLRTNVTDGRMLQRHRSLHR